MEYKKFLDYIKIKSDNGIHTLSESQKESFELFCDWIKNRNISIKSRIPATKLKETFGDRLIVDGNTVSLKEKP